MASMAEAKRVAGSKRARPASMEVVETTPVSQTIRQITRFPSKRFRRNPYRAIHNFKRTYDYGVGVISGTTAGPSYFGLNFSFNDIPGYTELSSLYDFYKITGVMFKCMPYQQDNASLSVVANNLFNAPIFYAIDRSDGTAPTTISEVLEYNDHKISSVWKGFQIYIKDPKFADATSAQRGGWVATSNPSLNWFGLKVAIPATSVAAQFYVVVTFYVACKDPK